MTPTALVIGSGVSGLTAAHELAERGFLVTVLEASREYGGKSRGISFEGTNNGDREPLPAEHGFRFFPGFYRHVPDSMARIPCTTMRGQSGTVLDNLVNTSRSLALSEKGQWTLPNELTRSSEDLASLLAFLYDNVVAQAVGVPRDDLLYYVRRVLSVLTSCEERRFGELENVSAWDYFQAGTRSEQYQKYLINAVTRSLVACRADIMSARSNVVIGIQILLDVYRNCSDRVLAGPTNEAWLTPWVRHLEHRGVRFVQDWEVAKLSVREGRVTEVVAADGRRISADYVVVGLPLEVVRRLVDDDLVSAAPSLAKLGTLTTNWMNGILFYLDRDIEFNHGHTIFMDSPWALTSLFQQRFWPGGLERYGDGRVRSILSVCISDFDTPGRLTGKTARACERAEIRREVWAQIEGHLRGQAREDFREANVLECFIDPALAWTQNGMTNSAPLFINTKGSWRARPDADVGLHNCFFAGDFVRTNTDVATMESANESARRAVNHVLNRAGFAGSAVEVFPLEEPEVLRPLKTFDQLRYENGLPHVLDVMPELSGTAARAVSSLVEASGTYAEHGAHLMRHMGWDRKLPAIDVGVRRIADGLRAFRKRGVAASPGDTPAGPLDAAERFGLLVRETVGDVADDALVGDVAALSNALSKALADTDGHFTRTTPHESDRVDDALHEFLRRPSKRIRAVCALLSGSMYMAAPRREVVQVAIIAEALHAATLLHDDIIDEADFRRGERTLSNKYGVATGLLAGNLLVSRAMRTLYQLGFPSLADELFGVIEELIAAESAQLSARHEFEHSDAAYLRIINGKTASLFAWTCRAGAVVGGAPRASADCLERFGRELGLAFQVIDDVLDVEATANAGKSPADLATGILTCPLLEARRIDPRRFDSLIREGASEQAEVRRWLVECGAIRAARARAARHAEAAIAELAPVRYSAARLALEGLCRRSVQRRR